MCYVEEYGVYILGFVCLICIRELNIIILRFLVDLGDNRNDNVRLLFYMVFFYEFLID